MKNRIIRQLCQGSLLALATTALADNAPLWLSTTNTVTAPAGTVVMLRAIADATPAPQYFWLSNAVPIPGATTNFIYLTLATSITNVKWSVVASNYLGCSTNGPFYVRTPTGTQTYYPLGNATLSGSNSVLDVLKIGDYISGTLAPTSPAYWLADVNQDGVVDRTDQNLVKDAILGRLSLTNINSLAVADPFDSGIPNWLKWELGLFQSTADSDGDGVPDGIEIANGTDPLNPTRLIPFGYYSASPPITLLNLTANLADAGVFVASPPISIFNRTANPADEGVFVATPPVAITNTNQF
jgi:hypothetical protein